MRWVFRGVDGRGLATAKDRAPVKGRRRRSGTRPAGAKQVLRTRTTVTTSGLFRVPRQPNLTLNLYAVNPSNRPQNIEVLINSIDAGAGISAKDTVLSRQLEIPAGQVAHLPVDPPPGEVLEIVTRQEEPDGAIVPVSATVVHFFPADAGTTPEVTLAAGSFTGAFPRHRRLTTGIINIPQGVAASRPHTEVLLSNFGSSTGEVRITVHELVEHQPTPVLLEEHTVEVPGQSGAIVSLEEVEGRPVEVTVDAPAGVVVSLTAYTLFLADDSSLPVFHLDPPSWVEIDSSLAPVPGRRAAT